MIKLSIDEILEAVNGSIYVDGKEYNYNSIETDTRNLKNNCIFVALKGYNFNGNEFVIDAIKKGSIICIVDELKFSESDIPKGATVIKVEDTKMALLNLAEAYRKKLNIKIIGITGSTGKTSTKDVTAAFLSSKFKVFKTKGNFNNEIGLPLMMFKIDESYDVAVLELGMSNFGEIHNLAKACRPDIALITNIGISHIENLKTRENILKAKMEITDFFSQDNTLIVNADNDMLSTLNDDSYEILTTSIENNDCNIKADIIEENLNNIVFTVIDDGEDKGTITLPLMGIHNVENSLLAYGAAKILGLTIDDMQKGLENLECTSMRLDVIEAHGKTIIDDSYNASPDSMKAALNVLKQFNGRKIAVLGTMKELGDESKNSHKEVGEYTKKNGAEKLIVISEFENDFKEGFGEDGFYAYASIAEARCGLDEILKDGDIILIKASRSMHFEELVKYLK
ncbi:UDP-N-acetylmuramoyl-tripeptide--D-alanyl-D-alanine ligase [Clostridium cadaveris]|uniref:UDP-N-acetylmuramoyl-tripeptide--D-alanyl-D- alanine ligase n=1 Tax=Clostridium cadaveris TaxID=1529 RepID=UPI0031D526F2